MVYDHEVWLFGLSLIDLRLVIEFGNCWLHFFLLRAFFLSCKCHGCLWWFDNINAFLIRYAFRWQSLLKSKFICTWDAEEIVLLFTLFFFWCRCFKFLLMRIIFFKFIWWSKLFFHPIYKNLFTCTVVSPIEDS